MANENSINVEVVYADQQKQFIERVEVSTSSCVREALEYSKIFIEFPELKKQNFEVGIFSRRVTLDTILKSGDRIEIYRPLLIDPKEARRLRARGC